MLSQMTEGFAFQKRGTFVCELHFEDKRTHRWLQFDELIVYRVGCLELRDKLSSSSPADQASRDLRQCRVDVVSLAGL